MSSGRSVCFWEEVDNSPVLKRNAERTITRKKIAKTRIAAFSAAKTDSENFGHDLIEEHHSCRNKCSGRRLASMNGVIRASKRLDIVIPM